MNGDQPDLFTEQQAVNGDAGIVKDLDKLFELSVQAYYAVMNALMDDTLDKTKLQKYTLKILNTVRIFETRASAGPCAKKDSPDFQLAVRAAADSAAADRGDPLVREVLGSAYRVGREIHRLIGLLRFNPGRNGIWIARCAPDNSVLPAFAEYFTRRFCEDPWAIIDEKRGLALVRSTGREPCMGPLSVFPFLADINCPKDEWEDLWRDYHRTVCISNRKNPVLQLQLMPRRYWKYLPEIN